MIVVAINDVAIFAGVKSLAINKDNYDKNFIKNQNYKRKKLNKNDDTAENPETLSLKGLILDSNISIDYYYPYFIRNNILKFDDDETKDINLMSEKCRDDKCLLCLPDHWEKCFKCKEGFLKLNQRCMKYCPEGYSADIVRRKCISFEKGGKLIIL